MPTEKFDPDATVVDINDLAEMVELTPRRLNQLFVEYRVPKPERGKVNLKLAMRAVCLNINPEKHRELMVDGLLEQVAELKRQNARLTRRRRAKR